MIYPYQFATILFKHLNYYTQAKKGEFEKEYKAKKISKEVYSNSLRAIFTSYGNLQVKSCIIKTVKDLIVTDPPTNIKNKEFKNLLFEPKRFFIRKPEKPNSVYVQFIGEKHTSVTDHERTNKILKMIKKEEITPSMVVFERGLPYPELGRVIHEENISTTLQPYGIHDFFGERIEEEEARSWLFAGFIIADLATGNQAKQENIFIFCGDRHVDILEKMEYLINDAAPHLKFRPRILSHYPSIDDPTILFRKSL